jgi:hypothetical protein
MALEALHTVVMVATRQHGCYTATFVSVVAQRLRHYATNRKTAGSIPDDEIF